jgi:alpha-glucosidase
MWWQDAVIYQIYPRSFQDSGGDGVGDLEGIVSRLDHVAGLGAAAVWISPVYVSPNADFGYDVADYTAVDPAYGTLEDLDRLIEAAHARGLKLLLDFVPCHTSIEHPWFRQRPEFYVRADEPPNNWLASFGGTAWQLDPSTGRYYLHSFFPEQADLDWRNPDVQAAMTDAMRFWTRRGVDGFRLDALDRLLKDPELRDDPAETDAPVLPLQPEYGRLRHVHSRNAPDIGTALRAIREAVGDALLVGEVFVATADLAPYLEALDVAFAFEPMLANTDVARLRSAIAAAIDTEKLGWVLSNHDFSRFATRFGENARAAALLFMSLPGPLFMLQGDEIGMVDGPGAHPPLDRTGRDPFRHPMQWDSTPLGGFTTGPPWLPLVDPQDRNVADQEQDPDSELSLYKRLIGLRRQLAGIPRFLDSPDNTLVLERGDHLVAVNFGSQPLTLERPGGLLAEARPGDGADTLELPAHGGWIAGP